MFQFFLEYFRVSLAKTLIKAREWVEWNSFNFREVLDDDIVLEKKKRWEKIKIRDEYRKNVMEKIGEKEEIGWGEGKEFEWGKGRGVE